MPPDRALVHVTGGGGAGGGVTTGASNAAGAGGNGGGTYVALLSINSASWLVHTPRLALRPRLPLLATSPS